MTAKELKAIFVGFFKSKNHVEIPSASLIPENDPTTLFISAGMHPLVPYLMGQPHPLGKRLVSVQKCLRTGDIDSVGDTFHHTFFEMLGNWSLGDYFKKDMIPWSFEFLTQQLHLDSHRIHVTCFIGDENSPQDNESAVIWQSCGITKDHIHFLPKSDNWWGPAGLTGPCGPDSEMFIDTQPQLPDVDFIAGCKQARYIEIWNDVFMEFNKTPDGKYEKLNQPNVDTGFGVERNIAILNGLSDNYLSPIWLPIIQEIEKISHKKYEPDVIASPPPQRHCEEQSDEAIPLGSPHPPQLRGPRDDVRCFRVTADHLRAAVFIIADGVDPSNKERGYVLRRLIRRSVRQGKLLGIEQNFCAVIAKTILANQHNYAGVYPELDQNGNKILEILDLEETKFRKTLDLGLREINKLISRQQNLSGEQAFDLYQSFGFPVELIQEELQKNNLSLNIDEYNHFKEEHIKQSQTLSAGKFKSGLGDQSEIVTKYHTVTHLLHAALRQVLGNHVQQAGSNITPKRLRFDFTHPRSLTEDQLQAVVHLVNQKISQSLPVTVTTMKFTAALDSGALAFFAAKYPETVTVYAVGEFSREVCTGPHVVNTKELGKFEITKQDTAGMDKRRLYAVLK